MVDIVRRANSFILQNGWTNLHPDINDLRLLVASCGYELTSYNQAGDILNKTGLLRQKRKQPAFSLFLAEERHIFYCDNLPYSEKLFAIGHELGHIVLEHTCTGILCMSSNPDYTTEQEKEADQFAYQLLAPLCVLRRHHVKTVEEVKQLKADRGV